MKLKDFLINELIDEIIGTALVILTVGFGISYFAVAQQWIDAVKLFGTQLGLNAVPPGELQLMYASIANTFPFNLFTQNSFNNFLIIGTAMLVVGIIIKILTTKSTAELVKDMGKIIMIPAIISTFVIVSMQILTAHSVSNLFNRAAFAHAEGTLIGSSAGLVIWHSMGTLFVTGLAMLFIGYIVDYTIRKMRGKPAPFRVGAQTAIVAGWIFVATYGLFRLLAIQLFAPLFSAQALKLFALMWMSSKEAYIVTILLFALGYALICQGNRMERQAKHSARESLYAHRLYAYGDLGKPDRYARMTKHAPPVSLQEPTYDPMFGSEYPRKF